MNKRGPWLWLPALLALMPSARAQDAEKTQSYRDVMQAQYAARQAPVPMGPAEAQKITRTLPTVK